VLFRANDELVGFVYIVLYLCSQRRRIRVIPVSPTCSVLTAPKLAIITNEALLTRVLQDWAASCQPSRAEHPHCLEGEFIPPPANQLLTIPVVVVLRVGLYLLDHRFES
jgi:hypothetical protein